MTKTVSGTTTIEAQYAYDPYGIATKLQGSQDADFQYAGYYMHGPSGLNLTRTRQYSASHGRWISRDPIGENGGLNLYGYVGGNPTTLIDPSGLATQIGTFAGGQGLIYMNDDGSIFTEGAKPDSDLELMIANGMAGAAKNAVGAACSINTAAAGASQMSLSQMAFTLRKITEAAGAGASRRTFAAVMTSEGTVIVAAAGKAFTAEQMGYIKAAGWVTADFQAGVHAEQQALNLAKTMGLNPQALAAYNTYICPTCNQFISQFAKGAYVIGHGASFP